MVFKNLKTSLLVLKAFLYSSSITQLTFLANTRRKCKFWDNTWQCKFDKGGCVVEECRPDEVPQGIKGTTNKSHVSSKLWVYSIII